MVRRLLRRSRYSHQHHALVHRVGHRPAGLRIARAAARSTLEPHLTAWIGWEAYRSHRARAAAHGQAQPQPQCVFWHGLPVPVRPSRAGAAGHLARPRCKEQTLQTLPCVHCCCSTKKIATGRQKPGTKWVLQFVLPASSECIAIPPGAALARSAYWTICVRPWGRVPRARARRRRARATNRATIIRASGA